MLSNSTNPGSAYLNHALDWFSHFLKGRRRILFIPFAGVTISWDEYTQKVASALQSLEVEVQGIHMLSDPVTALSDYEVIMVGGGNTFVLLKELQNRSLITAMRQSVLNGTPYIGWSAGSNIASPAIFTTNDMPVVQPESFDALHLLPFQLNPHYTEEVLPNFHGETRLQRIQEFLVLHPYQVVLGLPEGSALKILNNDIQLLNGPVARISHPVGRQWISNWDENAIG